MHKSATKCNETIGKWCENKHGASKIIDTFETYQVPILIGSQQTQHIELHKDDPDHVGQLTRSKHKAHGEGNNHLATAMDL
jgi:hypothetical protein